ncbi:sugar ABC transporter ATP-binding protein [Devosia riboflavina]|uniref:Sugar ABC transporter ATP-binding protein n=1 Tax=Devosia riboflavina TaxID=46914 RepID=A0A087LY12_9HYPH|nr:sn-glycerol-3-phosphate ABC transporter ATP-binding protein UgpC [Devosia riboflavina]KFL29515.1 sugar ABC transporter ATP-binding protein [Devosia riboflavina]
MTLPTSSAAALELTNICKSYGDVPIIHGIDLAIKPGSFVVFVGPSGCGKSTLLRMIAGLEPITSGDLVIDGQRMNEAPASRRGIAMVFQSYALYPHMDVYQNLSFGLETAKMRKAEIAERVSRAAKILKIEPLLRRKPRQLSGGQRQRVAIGRAIVREPRLFLFDEPLSNLDAELRVQMRVEISNLHRDLGTTMIYVTHDQVEAMTMADQIVVLNGGRVEQTGSPLDLYNYPRNLFVAAFIGSPRMNIFPTSALSEGIAGDFATTHSLGVRPEHLVAGPADVGLGSIAVEVVEHLGDVTILHGRLPNSHHGVTVTLSGQVEIKPGATLPIGVSRSNLHRFDRGGLRINDGAKL